MNLKLFIKIARQIYKIAAKLPRLPLPQKIEKEVLDCYNDFVNNQYSFRTQPNILNNWINY